MKEKSLVLASLLCFLLTGCESIVGLEKTVEYSELNAQASENASDSNLPDSESGAKTDDSSDGTAVAPKGYLRVDAGTFAMGSPANELGRLEEESLHKVILTRSFYLKATEVTQGEWSAVMKTNPSKFNTCGEQCPVEQVSWFDAIAYCNALSQRENLEPCYFVGQGGIYSEVDAALHGDVQWPKGLACEGYRLPTEAEWEYSARARYNRNAFRGNTLPTDAFPTIGLRPARTIIEK